MRIDWLEDLVALLDTGSVVEAATARNISQSAFSRRIQALENQIGAPLIDRETKPNRPTAALRNQEEHVRQIVLLQHQLIQRVQIDSRSGSQPVSIACQHAITTSLGPRIVKTVSGLGNAHVRLRSANRDECDIQLMTGQVDFSMTYRLQDERLNTPAKTGEELRVAAEKLVPVFAAQGSEETLLGLRAGRLDIVAYPPDVFLGLAMSRHVLPTVEVSGAINVVAETALTVAALEMARSGVGVAWVPEALVQTDLAEGRLVDFSNELCFVELDIVARRRPEHLSPLHSAVWEEFSHMTGQDQEAIGSQSIELEIQGV